MRILLLISGNVKYKFLTQAQTCEPRSHVGTKSMEWYRPLLKDLTNAFSRIDSQFELIGKIDSYIAASPATGSKKFHEILKSICHDLTRIANASQADVFLYSDNNFLRMGLSANMADLAAYPSFDNTTLENLRRGECCVLDDPTKSQLLLLPVISDKALFAIVALLGSNARKSLLSDEGFLSFAKLAANQIGIMINAVLEQEQRSLHRALIELFFNSKLDPAQCWQQIVNHISGFLPSWAPLALSPEPKVQLLLYDEGNR